MNRTTLLEITERQPCAPYRLADRRFKCERPQLHIIWTSWPILQTPQNRTFPTAVHDSHHRVDGTLAHFFFRDRHFLSNTDKYGSTLTPVSITLHLGSWRIF